MTEEKSCVTCRSYKDCAGHFYEEKHKDTFGETTYLYEYYTYAEIRFCPYQMKWLIKNLEFLKEAKYESKDNQDKYVEGHWLPEPTLSGYIDPSVRKTRAAKAAPFEYVSAIIAEVEFRLNRTGISGKLLVAEIEAERDLSPEAETALEYVKGWRRKRMSFSDWKSQRRHRMEGHMGKCTRCKKLSDNRSKWEGGLYCEECLKRIKAWIKSGKRGNI